MCKLQLHVLHIISVLPCHLVFHLLNKYIISRQNVVHLSKSLTTSLLLELRVHINNTLTRGRWAYIWTSFEAWANVCLNCVYYNTDCQSSHFTNSAMACENVVCGNNTFVLVSTGKRKKNWSQMKMEFTCFCQLESEVLKQNDTKTSALSLQIRCGWMWEIGKRIIQIHSTLYI